MTEEEEAARVASLVSVDGASATFLREVGAVHMVGLVAYEDGSVMLNRVGIEGRLSAEQQMALDVATRLLLELAATIGSAASVSGELADVYFDRPPGMRH